MFDFWPHACKADAGLQTPHIAGLFISSSRSSLHCRKQVFDWAERFVSLRGCLFDYRPQAIERIPVLEVDQDAAELDADVGTVARTRRGGWDAEDGGLQRAGAQGLGRDFAFGGGPGRIGCWPGVATGHEGTSSLVCAREWCAMRGLGEAKGRHGGGLGHHGHLTRYLW